jgi:hypothetical protein
MSPGAPPFKETTAGFSASSDGFSYETLTNLFKCLTLFLCGRLMIKLRGKPRLLSVWE